jgi:hypothetical protein
MISAQTIAAALLFTLTCIAGVSVAADAIDPCPGVYLGSRAGEAIVSGAGPLAGTPARGWPFALGENFGSPVLCDLNGDDIKEVITGNRSRLYVLDAAGNVLPGWPRTVGSVDNSVAVADVDEDGEPEIFVGAANSPPRLYGFNPDGTNVPGFPVNLPNTTWMNISAPAIADVDGDGHLDVGAQSERGVAFFDRFGAPLPGWPYLWQQQQNIVWSAPAVADLDGDGDQEVVVGNNVLYNWSIHVIRHDGTAMPGWPIATNNIFASPSVGDLDGDGDLEIVVQEGDPTWYGGRMHVLHHDGTYLPGWPRLIADEWESSRSNPMIVDADDDGQPEIVTATGDGLLHLFRTDGTEFPGYPRLIVNASLISTAQVIDIDADGIEEIFLTYYAGGNQFVGGWTLAGVAVPGFPKLIYAGSNMSAHSSVHIADLEGDGDLDLVAQGQTMGGGQLQLFEIPGSVFHPATSLADCPKIRYDLRNSGRFFRADPAGVDLDLDAADVRTGNARLRLAPNPAPAGAMLRLGGMEASAGLIALYDATGRCVGRAPASPATGETVIALRELAGAGAAPGLYLLRWVPADGRGARTARLTLLAD